MAYLVAFLTGAAFTLVETVSKYDKAPRFAVTNLWFLAFFLLTGIAGMSVFHLIQNDPRFTFGITNPYLQAVVIGLEWQILLRSKLFTLKDAAQKESNAVGFEFLYKKIAGIFELQIDRHEESKVLEAIESMLSHGKLSEDDVRDRAVNYVSYRKERGKLSATEAKSLVQLIENSDANTVMYTVFNLAGLKILKTLFAGSARKPA